MRRIKPVIARNARELADVLRLTHADGMRIEFRSDLNDKIIEVVAKKRLTHSDVARLAQTSRTRVTAILKRNTKDISTDIMFRVLASLGVQAKLRFKIAA
jgi:predicted XRE-type DNA-binding protein